VKKSSTTAAHGARAPRAPRPRISAELLGAALHGQSEGVLIAERHATKEGFKLVLANQSFCAMTGYSAAELTGRRHGFLHPEKAEFARLRRWAARAAPGQSFTGEGDIVRKDGASFYAAWSYSAVADARGHVTHFVATYRDMTEKRHLQEALVHAQRLDAVGRLAGGVAHDFNNLISVINGYCQILTGRLAGQADLLHEIEEIHKAGQKAASLTRQLLAFGRRQPMVAKVLNLNQLVRENAEILSRMLDAAGQLELKLAAEPCLVRADPDQLQQVLLNLTLNARDALRDHGRVTISTQYSDIKAGRLYEAIDLPPGHYVQLTVSDNGTGMDADTQAHLFEPFFTTKEPGKGSGLGLALVYGVVQQSGGFIRVHSTLLVGSTFEIYLPLVRGPVDLQPERSLPALTATRGHETVLLVESDEVVGKMVAGMLTADGYRVVSAQNTAQALQLARDQADPVQMLIAAVGNPAECTRLVSTLREHRPDLRVLCTATCEGACPTASLAKKRLCCLPKPFALSELLKATRQLLDT